MNFNEQAFIIPGPTGLLEGRLAWPSRPVGGAVVCHPNPLQGGTMHHKVVYILCSTLYSLGLAVARFNFRGVGASEGSRSIDHAQTADALAVIGWLQSKGIASPLWLAGFSFGAQIALRAHQRAGAQRLILVAPALHQDAPPVAVPTLVVHGDADNIIPHAQSVTWAANQAWVQLQILPGVDHFFHSQLTTLRQTVQTWGHNLQ